MSSSAQFATAQVVSSRDCQQDLRVLYTTLLLSPNLSTIKENELINTLENIAIHFPNCVGTFADFVYEILSNRGGNNINNPTPQAKWRKRTGTYITPWVMAERLVQYALKALDTDLLPPKTLDLGVGTGVFLSATLKHLAERGFLKEHIVPLLYGVDINPLALSLTRQILKVESSVEPPKDRFFLGDVLKDVALLASIKGVGPFGLIVTNPPYERINKLDGAEADEKELARRYAKDVTTKAGFNLGNRKALDSYKLFIERALELLHPRGVLAALIPANFVSGDSASELREYLLSRKMVDTVDIYPEGNTRFKRVNQAVAILVIRNTATRPSFYIKLKHKGEDFSSIYYSYLQSFNHKKWVIPLAKEDDLELALTLERLPKLGDIEGIEILRGELDQTMDKEAIGKGNVPFYVGRNVRPFVIQKGSRCSAEMLLAKWGEKRAKKRLEHIHSLRIAGRQVANQRAPRRLIFALIHPPAVLGNSLNYIVLTEKSPLEAEVLLAFLNSRLLDWYFRLWNTNNHVAVHELKALPVPTNVPTDLRKRIVELVRILSLGRESVGSDIKAMEVELNRLVLRAYGLEEHEFAKLLLREE